MRGSNLAFILLRLWGVVMDLATSGGLVVGVIVVLALILMGGDLKTFYDIHAIIVIFGGAFAATLVRFPLHTIMEALPFGMKHSFTLRQVKPRELVDEIAKLADLARRNGPIALESVEVSDPFLAKGIRYVADGYDADFIRDTMERDRDNFLGQLHEGDRVYRAIGDCAPAFGMIGTLIGMVQMFSNMSDPSTLGPFMAIALLATLYGAALANMFCLPIADKLAGKLAEEEVNQSLIIDGVLQIRESKNPALIREMLLAYLPEHHRTSHEEAA